MKYDECGPGCGKTTDIGDEFEYFRLYMILNQYSFDFENNNINYLYKITRDMLKH